MDKLVFDTAQQIWREIGHHKSAGVLKLEADLYKKLISIFQVGDYFYIIFNPPEMQVDHCSNHVTELLGIQPEEASIDRLLGLVHPDDLPNLVSFEAAVSQFWRKLPVDKVMKYKTRYDYRMKGKDGTYKRFLQQVVVVQSDEEGAVLRSFCLCTDISHLKTTNSMTLSFIGLDGEPSYIDVKPGLPVNEEKHPLTPRELEVLELLSKGLSSQDIGDQLFISKHTVEKHRKNMLAKTQTAQTVGLVMHALEKGWL